MKFKKFLYFLPLAVLLCGVSIAYPNLGIALTFAAILTGAATLADLGMRM